MNPFSYKMLSASELELHITGVIGDGWDDNPVTAKAVRKALGDAKNAKRIVCNVDSSGGSFFDGLAIYQMLQEHPATVDMVIGARAASAASLIAMAGDTITMHETSTFLVHPVWTVAIGNAAELRKAAEDLDLLTESSVKAYVARTGMDADRVRALMAEDRYMSAEEALKLGFCGEIRKAKKKASALTEQEVRTEIDAMRARVTASAAALRIAAMSPASTQSGSETSEDAAKTESGVRAEANLVPSTPSVPNHPTESEKAHATPPPNVPPTTPAEEKKTNMAQIAVILAALSLSEGASDSEIIATINDSKFAKSDRDRLLGAIGAKSTDEALGMLKGLEERAAAGDAAVAEAVQLRKQADNKAKADLIAAASQPATSVDPDPNNPHAGKLTPAQREWAKGVTMETLEGYLAAAPVILVGDGKREPLTRSEARTGKRFDELTAKEARQLALDDPEAFNQLVAEARSA